MSIAQDIERLESHKRELEQKLEAERRRNDMQAGALRESRAENAALIERVEKAAARIATFEKHFFDFHGSAERIQKQKHELEPPAPALAEPSTLKSKLSRLRHKADAAA